MKKILLTGGGTAGHVTPNLALVPYLKEEGFEIEYMGSYEGIEKRLVEEAKIPYYGISSGKLRRYMDVKNLTDPARIIKGLFEARHYMKEQKPDIVFSKGGFVSVPVIIAASEYHIPIVIHESDLSPGLANKLSIPRATKVCYSFPETSQYLSHSKAVLTGLPVREELKRGSKEQGLKMCAFTASKPTLLVIGGSLGSVAVNKAVRSVLPELLKTFSVIHICGKDKMDPSLQDTEGYRQFEYVGEELPDLFAAADIVISRAGANVINELAALRKPSLLIPLGTNASRGDQILNADSFVRRGFAEVLHEEDLTSQSLLSKIDSIYHNQDAFISAMAAAEQGDAAQTVTRIISEVLEEHQSHKKKSN